MIDVSAALPDPMAAMRCVEDDLIADVVIDPRISGYVRSCSRRARVNAGTERNRLTTGLVLYLPCCGLQCRIGNVKAQGFFVTLVVSFS